MTQSTTIAAQNKITKTVTGGINFQMEDLNDDLGYLYKFFNKAKRPMKRNEQNYDTWSTYLFCVAIGISLFSISIVAFVTFVSLVSICLLSASYASKKLLK